MSSTSSIRSVQRIVTSQRVQVAPGFFVRRPLPSPGIDMIDPWLMLDHFGPVEIAPGEASGVPDHPHRGFEPTTYLIEGQIEHRDSAGNHVVVRGGDINWMTAGSGIVHSELPPEDFKRSGGRMHGFQIWLNLPRADKMSAPHIQYVEAKNVPTVMIGDTRVKIIAGECNGTKAAVKTHSPVIHYHVTIPAGGAVEIPVAAGFNVCAYVASGRGWCGADRAAFGEGQLAVFGATGAAIALGADDAGPLDLLVLGGAPLNEPVFSYGPFVMSTREEIIAAMDDYHAGKMGEIGY